jgi:hypothetical protein
MYIRIQALTGGAVRRCSFSQGAHLSPDHDGITKTVEILSSPMCLVAAPWGGKQTSGYRSALPLDQGTIFSGSPFGKRHKDHFATIQFSSLGNDKVRMKATYWPILRFDQDSTLEPVGNYEFTLA